jgi:predicted RNA-binding protein with PUA-like domain
MSRSQNFWIIKNEVSDYDITQMSKDRKTLWTGVRNYQARNFMTQKMAVGDFCLFYHSNADPSGAAGIVRVSKAADTDPSALDKKSKYFDSKSTTENPIWKCVEVEFVKKLKRLVSIGEMRESSKLKDLMILQKGSRLSITPITENEFNEIVKLSEN